MSDQNQRTAGPLVLLFLPTRFGLVDPSFRDRLDIQFNGSMIERSNGCEP